MQMRIALNLPTWTIREISEANNLYKRHVEKIIDNFIHKILIPLIFLYSHLSKLNEISRAQRGVGCKFISFRGPQGS